MVQEILNGYLQSVYFFHRSSCAFGFQLSVEGEQKARNIKTNAEAHVGKSYVLNIDFKDFFHQLTSDKIKAIFLSKPFYFPEEIALILVEVVTYKGRLPMGAPTSPVLSNWATRVLDEDLETYAKEKKFTFTRFADDLTFSSLNPILSTHLSEIENIVSRHNLTFNPQKTKFYGSNDVKIVTGIVIGKHLGLETHYLKKVEEEIGRFRMAKEMSLANEQNTNEFLDKMTAQLRGQLEFIGFVYGKNHAIFKELNAKFRQARQLKSFEIMNWMEFNQYSFFSYKKKK